MKCEDFFLFEVGNDLSFCVSWPQHIYHSPETVGQVITSKFFFLTQNVTKDFAVNEIMCQKMLEKILVKSRVLSVRSSGNHECDTKFASVDGH